MDWNLEAGRGKLGNGFEALVDVEFESVVSGHLSMNLCQRRRVHLCENRPMESCSLVDGRNMHICAEKKNWTYILRIHHVCTSHRVCRASFCAPDKLAWKLVFCIRTAALPLAVTVHSDTANRNEFAERKR
jgi:hypothetical protein